MHVLEGRNVGIMWSKVVEETREHGENYQTWTGDRYPATCIDLNSNPDHSDNSHKKQCYPMCYPGQREV